jgi:2,5-diketo-D-gluconate reductase A
MTDNDHMTQASDVPVVSLPGGVDMPLVGLGTWKLSGHRAEAAVTAALDVGYRHIDTAVMYGNEAEIGSALAASKLDRGEVFVTTKIRPSDLGHEPDVLRRSLRALRVEYVDLWLVHWPPQRREQIRQIWNAVRKLRDEGLAKAIGVSNYDLAQIDDLIESTGEAPAVNQVRWSPALYDADVLVGHKARGIALEGYSALKDSSLTDPVTAEIAAAHDVTAAQVILRWHLEHGITVIPKSERRERLDANIDLFGFTLSQAEVAKLDDLGVG